jgi:hypothetical protein
MAAQVCHTDKLRRLHDAQIRRVVSSQLRQPFRLVFQSPFCPQHGGLGAHMLGFMDDSGNLLIQQGCLMLLGVQEEARSDRENGTAACKGAGQHGSVLYD